MAKVTVTTDEGEVVKIFEDSSFPSTSEEAGNWSHLARLSVAEDIYNAVRIARDMEAGCIEIADTEDAHGMKLFVFFGWASE